jgi:hypothetical protein
MTSRSRNYDRARQLLEWMASDAGQRAWTSTMLAFPASRFVPPPKPVSALGKIAVDLRRVESTPARSMAAERLALRVGYR